MTSHVYIEINLLNICQQSFLPFYIYFLKCWHRLNDPNRQYTYIVVFLRSLEICRKASFSVLFRSECKWILHYPTTYVYHMYLAISKKPKQLPSCLKRVETCIVLIVVLWCPLWSPRLCCCRFLPLFSMNQVPE
jgi:hypothetical protein